MSIPAMQTTATTSDALSGCRLVAADGRTLPLRGAKVTADAKGGVARVVLSQRFVNPYEEPLHVTYLMPLPADGAVAGYAFTIGARRIVGEVDRKKRARERFERALAEGKSAGIVEEERSSLFTQELGNIPPGAELVAEITVTQPLKWIEGGGWEWRFPTAIGPRYQGAPGRVADAGKLEVAIADRPLPVTLSLALQIHDALPAGKLPDSPSHPLQSVRNLAGHAVTLLADEGMRLDRDLVVRWAAATPAVGVSLATGRPAHGRAPSAFAFGLLTLVPPSADAARAMPRDLIFLLDTSGSMGGRPLQQVKAVCAAMIDTLGDNDRLEMIEFSTTASRWQRKAVHADAKQKKKAKEWLSGLEASGGTEMVSGVMEALAPLSGESQRQVILLTDGYIGFETDVVRAISDKLPPGSRLHVVGVGSSVNRSLTGPSARAGRGIEVVIGIDEDAERAAKRLCARTAQPIVTNVTIDGDAVLGVAPARLPDLYGACPALAAVKLAASGGTLRVRGKSAEGEWSQTLKVAPSEPGEGLGAAATLFARETVEDLELQRAAGAGESEIDPQIEKIGLDFQISTRLTTWVAIAEEASVDPTSPTRSEIVPQELPHGVSAEGVGLRAPQTTLAQAYGGAMATGAGFAMPSAPPAAAPMMAGPPSPVAGAPKSASPGGMLKKAAERLLGALFEKSDEAEEVEEPAAEASRADDARAPEPRKAVAPADVKDEAPAKQKGRRDERQMTRAGTIAIGGPELRGVIRLEKDGQVVLEVSIDEELEWALDKVAVGRGPDGALIPVTIVAESSTRDGTLKAGQKARLVFTVPAGYAMPQTIHFPTFTIRVERA